MFRNSLLIVMMLFCGACSTLNVYDQNQAITLNNNAKIRLTLSHVRAYLLIGNLVKADELFQTVRNPKSTPDAMMVLSELRAAKEDSLGAQQAFIFAIGHENSDNFMTAPPLMLTYFCKNKMWPALDGYGKSVLTSKMPMGLKNSVLTTIGSCYFAQSKWKETKAWFEKIDFSADVEPIVYLASARANAEYKQYDVAQEFIEKYDFAKKVVSAKTLWTAFEIYMALKQQQQALQIGEQLLAIFPNNRFTRKYIVLEKRNLLPVLTVPPEVEAVKPKIDSHIIQKGETLYQLAKRYGLTTPELLSWNPELEVDNISLGTVIRLTSK